MKQALKALIRLYQLTLSPLVGNQCRFSPTCSCYMHEAIDKHGSIKGVILGVWRLLKCHPYTKTGFLDPVPERFDIKSIIGYKGRNARQGH